MPWATVYEVDWRDAFTSLGAVDLNSVGSSFTFDSIEWKTPSLARGNPVNQVASISWGLVAGGLRCDSPDNSRFVTTNNSAPHIWALLTEIAANDVSPFEPDATKPYLIQGFWSSLVSETGFDLSGAHVAIYKVTGDPAGVGPNFCACGAGRQLGVINVNFGTAGVGSAPPRDIRNDLTPPLNTLCVHYRGANRDAAYAAAFDTSGDGAFPANGALRFCGAHKDTTEFAPDLVMDPQFFRVAPAVNNAVGFSPNAYDCTFERFRLLQWE